LKKNENNEQVYLLGQKSFACPVALTSNAINGKWKLQILNRLSASDVLRFGELKKLVNDVSEKMLIQHLKELETDGLIERKVYPVVPPKVEYTLTKQGRAFIPIIEAMRIWGSSFMG
jgi:DNA-binding HxlR family transcriptional regulator